MRQVIFWVPIPNPWFPQGFPIYGFGLMLFLTFITCTMWCTWRARKEGVNPQILQDLAVWIFVGGIIGARITFMIQYQVPIWQFFEIWKGGLVFYGSAIGGLIAYVAAYYFVLRKNNVNTRQLADIIAPAVAWGLMLGRIGCLLNGCCYGNVACPNCWAIHFPLAAPPRYTLVQHGWQTAAGFTLADRSMNDHGSYPLSRIGAVAADSPAAESGLHAGDVVLKVNGLPNERIIEVRGKPEELATLAGKLRGRVESVPSGDGSETLQIFCPTADDYNDNRKVILSAPVHLYSEYDTLWDLLVNKWPRGEDKLELEVQRGNTVVALSPFVPRTLGLYPTQLFEVISMALLFVVLNFFFPLRRHYGEVIALLVICYACHRFLNEMLRNDTDPVAFGMTLSENGSIMFGIIGIGLFIWLWRKPVDRELLRPEEKSPEPATSASSA
jgi:prolipoprotein diacylglyceryltransferase